MGLLLICPHCRDRVPLPSWSCPACGADLRDLPPADRCYFFGEAEESAATLPAPATAAAAPEEFLAPMLIDTGLPEEHREVSLCEALDRILNKGAVLVGEVVISVADIDLVYLGLQVILASMETARGFQAGPSGPNLFEKRAL